MARPRTDHSEARQRLLETADRLFYRHGIRAVGVDRVIAEAGVAKMTLYSHFPSKDDLILAVLKHREEAFLAAFVPLAERHRQAGMEPVRALFAALKEIIDAPDFRGCAFINAAVELADRDHPGAVYAREAKRRMNDSIRRAIQETVGASAAGVAPAVALLFEGAMVTALLGGDSTAADVAADAADTLVRSVAPPG